MPDDQFLFSSDLVLMNVGTWYYDEQLVKKDAKFKVIC
jgi:hypothetical protein